MHVACFEANKLFTDERKVVGKKLMKQLQSKFAFIFDVLYSLLVI